MAKTIEWADGIVKILDQTELPAKTRVISCKNYRETADAIKKMKIRGAPALAVAAAYGFAQGILASRAKTYELLAKDMKRAADILRATRPTAVNLGWALDRMLLVMDKNRDRKLDKLRQFMVNEALAVQSETADMDNAMGGHGSELIRSGDRILTHCNTGGLATGGADGTALGVIIRAHKDKKKVHVWVDETRPYLQGARLTAWELKNEKIPHTLITDNTAAALMARKEVDVVIVGADRIASNGDVANKIGTYGLAILAYEHNIPFYVVAPKSTIDLAIATGAEIPIEERSADEVVNILGKTIAPKGTKALHLGFDVTPARLISAIVTEDGVIRAPYNPNVTDHMKASEEPALV